MIGFARVFSYETAYKEMPAFWDEIMDRFAPGKAAGAAYEKVWKENRIGEYGVCIDDEHYAEKGSSAI